VASVGLVSEPPENSGRKADGTFASGNRANPSGKPKGTRHRATMMAEKLLSADAVAIIKKLVAAAKAGEPWALRFVAERLIPPVRDRAAPLSLPKMTSAADLPDALGKVIDAMAEGALTPSEAAAIVATLEAYGRASVFAGHEERLARLERRLREEGQDDAR
jgi:hypothetical protein